MTNPQAAAATESERAILHRPFSEGRLFTVFHSDDRRRVSWPGTGQAPFRMICAIDRLVGGQWKPHATGFLIDRDRVATAAHNLHPAIGQIRLRFGRDHDHYAAEQILTPGSNSVNPAYLSDTSVGNDAAVINLSPALGDTLGWFSMKALSDNQIAQLREVDVAGYPTALEPPLSSTPRGYELWHHVSTAATSNDAVLYTADTSSGQSGGPVFIEESPGVYAALGIHAKPKGNPDPNRNAAFRFTNAKITLLLSLG